MKQIAPTLAALLVIAAGCAPDLSVLDLPAGVSQQQSPIVNGTIDLGHVAVGIVHSGGMGGCTGTLIGSNKVLTAAHCVLTQTKPYKVIYPINFYLGGLWGQKRTAISVAPHPSYNGGNQADLAVFLLSSSFSNVYPYELASTAPKAGDKITIVGYGLPGDAQGEFGTKRSATALVSQVQPSIFAMAGGTGAYGMICNGDSGGPSFAWQNNKEVVVGVHSTSAQGCASMGVDMRVDAYRQWITTLKITQKVYGGACLDKTECTSGICMPTGSTNICTQECDSKACPSGDDCLPYSGTEATKVCLPGTGNPNAFDLGGTCSDHADCKSNICAAVTSTQTICSQICDTKKQNCPDKYYCIASTLGGLCIPGEKPAGSTGLGDACSTDKECASGYCAKLGGAAVCASWCDTSKSTSCPSGFLCTPIAGQTQGLCLGDKTQPSTKKAFGAACASHAECDSGMCASDAGGKTFCTATCDPAQGCTAGAGYDCVPAGAETHVCAPSAGDDGGGGSGCALGPPGVKDPGRLAGLLALALPLLLLLGARRRRG